ncbi:MAG: hypothetical protein AAFX02_11205, partial [Pseudomonadota bacterium]
CGALSGKARRAEKAYVDFQKVNQFQAKRHNQAVKSHQDLGMNASRLREEYNEASRKVERNLAELLSAKRFAYREFVSAYNVVVGNTPLMTEAQADQLFLKTLATLSDVEKMDDPDLRSMMAKIQINDLVRVASNGHFGARKKLASIYAGDFLLDRDPDAAMHWLALAAKSGADSETMLTLARAYQSGSLGKQSDEQAFLWFLEASQFDDENGRQAIEALTNFQETPHSEQIETEPLAEETLQP